MTGSHYTDEQRRQAVVAYQVLGSGAAVHLQYGIPESTLSEWRQSEWWNELTGDLRSEVRDEIEATQTRLLRETYLQLEDRVKNGDATLIKRKVGDDTVVETHRVPVRCRDLAVTSAILFDKRQLLLNQPTSISQSGGVGDLAAALIGAFRKQPQRTIEGQAELIETQETTK